MGNRGNRRRFSEEFKRDAVELVVSSDRSIAEVARELGIYDSSLGNWVRRYRIDRGEVEGLSTQDAVRLAVLERGRHGAGGTSDTKSGGGTGSSAVSTDQSYRPAIREDPSERPRVPSARTGSTTPRSLVLRRT
jgi:transposase